MAIRLSVVMVHCPPPTATAAQIAEAVVGELIGRPGVDLTLVGPLAQIGQSSTELLTLGSLAGDVAVLDWQSPEQILTALRSIGFEGQRSAHAHDPTPPSTAANERRIYAFDLTRFLKPADVLEAISKLKANREVRTFSLGPGPQMSPTSTRAALPQTRGKPERPTPTDQDLVAPSGKPNPSPQGQPPPAASTSPKERETLNLDDLLDQLDEMDP